MSAERFELELDFLAIHDAKEVVQREWEMYMKMGKFEVAREMFSKLGRLNANLLIVGSKLRRAVDRDNGEGREYA